MATVQLLRCNQPGTRRVDDRPVLSGIVNMRRTKYTRSQTDDNT